MIVENLGPIDVSLILECYSQIEAGISWSDYVDKKQTSLQYKFGDDIWSSSSGKSKGDELSYDCLNPFFKNTIFEEIIKKYNLKRTRLMWVSPRTCYSMHADTTPRVHIPLVTYPDCYFVFKHRQPIHLSAGHVYKVDTRLMHTFMNCTDNPRLHIVGVVEK
jgi:hypothetical protein